MSYIFVCNVIYTSLLACYIQTIWQYSKNGINKKTKPGLNGICQAVQLFRKQQLRIEKSEMLR